MQNRLKELRQKNNLTLVELGKKVGLANNTLSQYETGKREPKLETWQKLADFFDVPVSYLQGFGLSNKQAIQTVWNWIYGKKGYDNYPIDKILKTFFKTNYSHEELQKIFKDEQSFAHFMNKRFRSVFNYESLSKMKTQEDLERKLTIVVGSTSREGLYDSVLAQIDDIDFKNDTNDRIHEVLGEVFNEVFMYIDSIEKD